MAFKSNLLARTWEKCKDLIEGYFQRLDDINADIRELEERLTAAKFEDVLVTEIFVSDEKWSDNDVTVYSELLFWSKVGKRWRIVYRETKTHGESSFVEGTDWLYTQIVEAKPLLECPTAVRIRVENALDELIKEAAKQRAASPFEVSNALNPTWRVRRKNPSEEIPF